MAKTLSLTIFMMKKEAMAMKMLRIRIRGQLTLILRSKTSIKLSITE
jgi:hypothetical protein